MSRRLGRIALCLQLLLVGSVASAQVTVGAPPNGGNCFPFGCALTFGPSTRYQQVYAASEFPGATLINRIRFSLEADFGGLNTGSYAIFFSTTPRAVNGLSTTFDDNVGADAALFGNFVLSGGAAPAILSFTGNTFAYDPAAGNLLVDIHTAITASGNSYYASRDDVGNTVTSRMHDFGQFNEHFGLVTTFDLVPVSAVPEPGSVLLLAAGLAGVGLLARRRRAD